MRLGNMWLALPRSIAHSISCTARSFWMISALIGTSLADSAPARFGHAACRRGSRTAHRTRKCTLSAHTDSAGLFGTATALALAACISLDAHGEVQKTHFADGTLFDPPQLGTRKVDFDTEGVIHYGLFPEYVQDARNMGMSDADLEPFFRSAEGYVRMWERAQARAATLK